MKRKITRKTYSAPESVETEIRIQKAMLYEASEIEGIEEGHEHGWD